MAGDWMKVEKSTPDKPEIYAIADLLSIDPDAVFGKCFRIWSWFDDHTTNGKTNGCSVSKMLVDRLVSVSGFADCMISVGWLVEESGCIYAKNFERHNGKTAKNRALTANRVAKHTNAKLTQKLTLDALPREEKRRVNNISTIPSLFVEFWNAYGKKVGKPNALKEWKKISPSDDEANEIISAANTIRLSRPDPTYRKDPERWLKARGWEDEIQESKSSTSDTLTELFARAI